MDTWQIVSIDLPPVLAASFSSVACALLGNYLVLRRLSLMGDAISHSVLPGIVVAFLLTSSRGSVPVFIGAAAAGIGSAVLIEFVRRYGRVESGAAMGVIFSIFFALGVLLIEQAAARSVDLDADCLLHGQLESIFWNPPRQLSGFFSIETLFLIPNEVVTSLITMLVILGFVLLLYKELRLVSFDPALASSLGFSSQFMHNLLMILVACAVVASFRVVGSILVIAMIICPAAAARMCTDRLGTQLIASVMFALLSCFIGYSLGAFGPIWLGYQNSVSAAGMIAVVSGGFLGACAVLAPRHGIFARFARRWLLAFTVRKEDILAFLYRATEISKGSADIQSTDLRSVFGVGILTRLALRALNASKLIQVSAERVSMTQAGRDRAQGLVRSHRLWESYLVSKLGLKPDHVHQTAEQLEHFTGTGLQQRVAETEGTPKTDPHGREIPH